MDATVRLTRLAEGGFRITGAADAPIDVVREEAGFAVGGDEGWRLIFSEGERGWLLTRRGEEADAGRTSSLATSATSPSSVLLPDGRLFRLAPVGLSDPSVELGRWDVPGAYVVGRPVTGGWELTRTVAGTALDMPKALWILTCAEIGRLDGWYGDLETAP